MKEEALQYIPHKGKMALINSITATGDDWVECVVNPQDSNLFNDLEERVPSWLGIEYMAQAIAAYAGWTAKKNNEEVQLGFLLGTRHYSCQKNFFDGPLKIKAALLFQSDELASFNCGITCEKSGEKLAEARINVYQPENFSELTKDQNHE